jgi:hypothetical protein
MFRNVRFLKRAIDDGPTPGEGDGTDPDEQQSKKTSDNDEFYRAVNGKPSRQTSDDDEFARLLAQGESESLELMSPEAGNFGQLVPDNDKTLSPEHITRGGDAPGFILAKTIAGFLNTSGGNLMIFLPETKEDPVEGDGKGIEHDYPYVNDNLTDGYQRMITDAVQKYFDTDFFTMQSMFLSIEFKKIRGKTVCRITIKKSDRPLFLTSGTEDVFFVRTGAQTREIRKIKDLYGYISRHFQ